MGKLRSLSRSAHPAQWAERARRNRLRRLTQRMLRLRGKGDLAASARLDHVIRQITGEPDLWEAPSQQVEDPAQLFNPTGYEETGGNSDDSTVTSIAQPANEPTDEED